MQKYKGGMSRDTVTGNPTLYTHLSVIILHIANVRKAKLFSFWFNVLHNIQNCQRPSDNHYKVTPFWMKTVADNKYSYSVKGEISIFKTQSRINVNSGSLNKRHSKAILEKK